jgi:hypothetical protein
VIRPRLARVHHGNVHNPYSLRIHSGTLVRHEPASQRRNVTESVPQISVITEAAGLYCEDSWGPTWAHVYVCGLCSTTIYFLTGFFQLVAIVSISVSIAMYCLLQLYFVISADIAPYRPLLQLFSVKAVVFLTFWQGALLGVLASFGVVKDVCY